MNKMHTLAKIIITILAVYGLGLTIYNNFIGSIGSSPIIYISIIILTIIAYSLVLKGFLIIAGKNNKLRNVSIVYFILLMFLSTIQTSQLIRIPIINETINSLFVGTPLILGFLGLGVAAILFGKESLTLKEKYGFVVKGLGIMAIAHGIISLSLIPFTLIFAILFSQGPFSILFSLFPLFGSVITTTMYVFGALFFLKAAK